MTSSTGPITLLEAVKNSSKKIKYYQASSSEMYGGKNKELINENTNFDPRSPYAAGKVLHIILQKFIETLMTYFV